jgi:hypothetical protein
LEYVLLFPWQRRKSAEQCTALISVFPEHALYTRKRKKDWRDIEPKRKEKNEEYR